jgi:hypothetical protein
VVSANPLEATFIGASLLGDVKVKGFVEVSREAFNSSQGRNVMDWSFVGGVGKIQWRRVNDEVVGSQIPGVTHIALCSKFIIDLKVT